MNILLKKLISLSLAGIFCYTVPVYANTAIDLNPITNISTSVTQTQDIDIGKKLDESVNNIKTGLKEQEIRPILIMENQKGMLEKGQLVLEWKDKNISFAKTDILIETTGGLEVTFDTVKDNRLMLNVKKQSKEAGSLVLKGVKVDTDRTVAEGGGTLKLGGEALYVKNTKEKPMEEYMELEDYITISTPNTENLK